MRGGERCVAGRGRVMPECRALCTVILAGYQARSDTAKATKLGQFWPRAAQLHNRLK